MKKNIDNYTVEFYDWVNSPDGIGVKDLKYLTKKYSSNTLLEDLLIKFQNNEKEIRSRININNSFLTEVNFNSYNWLGYDNDNLAIDEEKEFFVIEYIYEFENLKNFENIKNIEGFIIQLLWDKKDEITKLFNTEELAIDSYYNKIRTKLNIVVNEHENDLNIMLDYELYNREDLKNYTLNKVLSLAKEFETILDHTLTSIN